MAVGCPDQPAGVVIDDDHQVLVATPIGDLVDPDPFQPVERVTGGAGVGHDAGGDRADGAPRGAHQLDDGGLRRVRHQPRHLIIERFRVPRVVTSPRHPSDDHPMITAAHPWRVGLQEHTHGSCVQCPPPAPALTGVIAAATPPATAVAQCR